MRITASWERCFIVGLPISQETREKIDQPTPPSSENLRTKTIAGVVADFRTVNCANCLATGCQLNEVSLLNNPGKGETRVGTSNTGVTDVSTESPHLLLTANVQLNPGEEGPKRLCDAQSRVGNYDEVHRMNLVPISDIVQIK